MPCDPTNPPTQPPGGIGWVPIDDNNISILTIQLGLNNEQTAWLEDNPTYATELLNYLQNTTNPKAIVSSLDHLNRMMTDPAYLGFVQNHHRTGNTAQIWWEDDTWLDEPFKFNLDLDKAENDIYDKLTLAEKQLVKQYPLQAYSISRNKTVAENETLLSFGTNGLNDKSDAFRHAFFNAINMRDCGRDPLTLENIAKLFSDAHESETLPQLQKEKDMDLFNNSIGHIVGDVIFPILVSNTSLSNEVFNKLLNGELRYLKPVEPTPPNVSNGINNDFWHINGKFGKHGISNATKLRPTNQ